MEMTGFGTSRTSVEHEPRDKFVFLDPVGEVLSDEEDDEDEFGAVTVGDIEDVIGLKFWLLLLVLVFWFCCCFCCFEVWR